MSNPEDIGQTGTTVIGIEDEGQFEACQTRTHLCGFACCKFHLGNWIFASEAEYEEAVKMDLSFDHLTVTDIEGGKKIVCHRPCVPGEFKSIDCSIYGVFPANAECTKFIVHDNRKCPIPHHEMFDFIRKVQKKLFEWELKHPGSLEQMSVASKGFKAYQPFPYEIKREGHVRLLSLVEMKAICPDELLDDDFKAHYSGVDNSMYGPNSTPENPPLTKFKFEPLD